MDPRIVLLVGIIAATSDPQAWADRWGPLIVQFAIAALTVMGGVWVARRKRDDDQASQVTTELRARLADLSAQLADTKARIKELEYQSDRQEDRIGRLLDERAGRPGPRDQGNAPGQPGGGPA